MAGYPALKCWAILGACLRHATPAPTGFANTRGIFIVGVNELDWQSILAQTMTPDIARILDANINRAREALRVMEDYARFVLDDATGCEALKGIRHGLADIVRQLPQDALLQARNTPGDVGTTISTGAEPCGPTRTTSSSPRPSASRKPCEPSRNTPRSSAPTWRGGRAAQVPGLRRRAAAHAPRRPPDPLRPHPAVRADLRLPVQA